VKTLGLIGILILGLALRIIWLDKYPPGFTPDEAAFGYNAYSLIQTGKDEWGTAWYSLPFTNLKSFGDYKLPLYAFLTIPSIKYFGLNEFSVRLPNAIIGTLAVLAIYLLTKELFTSLYSPPPNLGWGRGVVLDTPMIAALLFAISPWSIQLSRGAFEANLVTLFLPLGLYLFLSGSAFWSAVVLGLNFYSYHSARLLALPVILILLFFRPAKIRLSVFLVTLVLVMVPGIWSMFSGNSSRVTDVSILSPTDDWQAVSDRRFIARISGLPDSLARVFSNKLNFTFSVFVHNYLSYFSPQFLFTQGPAEGTYGMLPGRGVLYLIELPLLISFLVLFIKKPRKELLLLLLLFTLTPIPAALAKGPGYAANRAAVMIPFLLIASAIGLAYVINSLIKWIAPRLLLLFTITIYLLSLLFFLESYIYHSGSQIGPAMLYGRREAFTRVANLSAEFPEVRISRSLSEPHIYLAFYTSLLPSVYQISAQNWPDLKSLGLKFLDQYDGYTLGKYRFGDLHLSDPVTVPTLFIGSPSDFPSHYSEYFHIDSPDGRSVIKVARKDPI